MSARYGEEYLVDFIVQCFAPIRREKNISSEQAIADAEVLLLLMQLTYGAYSYYGGDQVFIPIFDRIIEDFSAKDVWNTEHRIGDFANVFHKHLGGVITDNHFAVAYDIIGETNRDDFILGGLNTIDFYVGETTFIKTKHGFQAKDSGLYLESIPGYDLFQIMRLIINDDGDISYSPIINMPGSNNNPTYPINLVYRNGEQETVSLLRYEPHQMNVRDKVFLLHRDDIPIIKIMRMGPPNDTEAHKFFEYAEELKDEPVIIIDIRSNVGGSSILPAKFLHRLLDELVPSNCVTLELGSQQDYLDMWAAAPSDNPWYIPIDEVNMYYPTIPFGESHHVSNHTPDAIIINKPLLILLTDRFTYSAAERFIDLSLNLKNCLIIGQNTGGMIQTTGGPGFYLPNSGITVNFGQGLFLFPENTYAEGVGFTPDLWATGDALEAALALIENYGGNIND